MASRYGSRHGLPGYDKFKTGLTFAAVRQMLWSQSEDSGEWKRKGRGTVLGLWHELKMDMWERACARIEAEQAAAHAAEHPDDSTEADAEHREAA